MSFLVHFNTIHVSLKHIYTFLVIPILTIHKSLFYLHNAIILALCKSIAYIQDGRKEV